MNTRVRPHHWLLFVLASLPWATDVARAQWPTSVSTDIVVTNTAWFSGLRAVSDGAGGVIVAWSDIRALGQPSNIYVQRYDVNGFRMWAVGGVALDAAEGAIDHLRACPDDSGGVIVAWHKGSGTRSGKIIAQRVDAVGQVRWGIPAPRVNTFDSWQTFPRIAADGAGGCIVGWFDARLGSESMFLQRLTRDGTQLWASTGASVAGTNSLRTFELATRSGGGAYLQWQCTGQLVRCAAIDASASLLWGPSTFSSLLSTTSPPDIGIIPDGQGGAIAHTRIDTGIMVRRLTGVGPVGTDAVRLNPATWGQNDVRLASDGAGGALISWLDGRDIWQAGLFAQHWLSDGTRAWPDNGVALGLNVQNSQGRNGICSDGAGGVIGVWAFSNASMAGRLSAGGAPVWASQPLQFTDHVYSSTVDPIPTTLNGAIAVWQNDFQIRAKRIMGNGSLATLDVGGSRRPDAGLALAASPTPTRGAVTLRLSLARASHVIVEVFGVRGERVALLADGTLSAGAHDLAWDARRVGPGVYLGRVTTPSGTVSTRLVRID